MPGILSEQDAAAERAAREQLTPLDEPAEETPDPLRLQAIVSATALQKPGAPVADLLRDAQSIHDWLNREGAHRG